MNTETYILYAEQKPKPEDFPIVAKFEDGILAIWNYPPPDVTATSHSPQGSVKLRVSTPTHWTPFREPAMPPPPKVDAWVEFWESLPTQHLNKTEIFQVSWDTATKHATERERKRFGEQVNALIKKFIEEGTDTLVADLRRIAGGENI